MARVNIFISFLFLSITCAFAQQFDERRITDWSRAGSKTNQVVVNNEINVLDFGADASGNSSTNEAFSMAIQALNNQGGIIYFPAGEYFFDAGISIPDSVQIVGESVETVLRFDLGGHGSLIHINGTRDNEEHLLAENVNKGDLELHVTNAEAFQAGDLIKLSCHDEDLMYSSWAYGTLGQIVEVVEKQDNTLFLADPITLDYPLIREPKIQKINPVCAAGISCLKIIRDDASESQTSNIYINNAIDCTIENIESANCNFTHIEINSSAHISIRGSYFHHAHAYGGGGQGYGVVFQATSSFNLAEDNIFSHLRHSMLLQSGATGNVYAYNYSKNPFWEAGMLPSNSAGDAVLHGNYPHHNLFEGNVVQNIVVDASHGSNGPYNTFFRNRAELYGFFSDSGTPTDSMNVVANEITNSGFPFGLFMVNGNGHYLYGNNVYGTPTPSATDDTQVESMFKEQAYAPGFTYDFPLPLIGYPNGLNDLTLAAETRATQQNFVACNSAVVTTVDDAKTERQLPYVTANGLTLPSDMVPSQIQIFSMHGSLVEVLKVNSNQIQLPRSLSHGIYILNCQSRTRDENIKVLISP